MTHHFLVGVSPCAASLPYPTIFRASRLWRGGEGGRGMEGGGRGREGGRREGERGREREGEREGEREKGGRETQFY